MNTALPIRYPIIQAPMAGGATTPELIAAVSNAGGLGSLGAGYMTPADIRRSIHEIRRLTDKPFIVNLFIPNNHHATKYQLERSCQTINNCSLELGVDVKPIFPPYTSSFDDQMRIILEEKVPIFSFTFGILDNAWIHELNLRDIIAIGTATTLQEACALEKVGIDMIVLQGSEAGGHRGTFLDIPENSLISLHNLLSECLEHIKIPTIASGGIMNGKQIAEALALGANAVQMGTAFLTTHESGIHKKYKEALLAQHNDNTVLTRAFSGKLARGIQNKFIKCMSKNKDNILDYPIQNALTKEIRKKSKEINSVNFLSMWAGQSASLCRSLNADVLMSELIAELKDAS